MTPIDAALTAVHHDVRLDECAELLVRSTHMVVVTVDGDGSSDVRTTTHGTAEVRLFRGRAFGTASTELTDLAGLRTAIADARSASYEQPVEELPAVPSATLMFRSADQEAPDVDALLQLARQIAGRPGARATVGQTSRTVHRTVSTQGTVGFTSREVAAYGHDTGTAGVVAARIVMHPGEVNPAALHDELDRARALRALPPGPAPEAVRRCVLTSAACARLLSWVVPALSDLGRSGERVGEHVGSDVVTLVDDQSGDWPNGHAFDDFGFPGRRVVMVDKGRLRAPLSASGDPALTTSSASRGQWTVAQPAMAYLQPAGKPPDTRAAEWLVDTVSVSTSMTGAGSSGAQLTLTGTRQCDGTPLARERRSMTCDVSDVLRRIVAVGADPVLVQRYRGLYGGTTVELDLTELL